ncbi:MAG: tyrosine-type recombinase/integrase [Actinomycetota bacterium]|nr:tyrosine-type recombinase/integrase [Actinomycetota bacterium]
MRKRAAKPDLSPAGKGEIRRYEGYLRDEQDLASDTVRNYLSDLRQFAAFCEVSWAEGEEAGGPFSPASVTTPTITLYRSHLKNALELKPASINRHLVSIKRYFGWATDEGLIARDPARAVKLVPRIVPPPRHLSDKEEAALVAAAERYGSSRDRTLIVVALHTGLRAEELCGLKPSHVRMAKRSGSLQVWGKRGKYREVPLNSTAREALSAWIAELPEGAPCLFPSRKRGEKNGEGGRGLRPITDRALGYVVEKYAALAKVEDVSPHDLRHRFGYEMAKRVPLHRLAQIMGHDSLDTTMVYVRGTQGDLQRAVEERAWA